MTMRDERRRLQMIYFTTPGQHSAISGASAGHDAQEIEFAMKLIMAGQRRMYLPPAYAAIEPPSSSRRAASSCRHFERRATCFDTLRIRRAPRQAPCHFTRAGEYAGRPAARTGMATPAAAAWRAVADDDHI